MKGLKKSFFMCIITMMMTLFMAACSPYVSSYKAAKMTTDNTGAHSYMEFYDLDGTYVLKMKATDGGSEGVIRYTATLEYGEINVYYDCFGVKEFLFNIKEGGRESL